MTASEFNKNSLVIDAVIRNFDTECVREKEGRFTVVSEMFKETREQWIQILLLLQ